MKRNPLFSGQERPLWHAGLRRQHKTRPRSPWLRHIAGSGRRQTLHRRFPALCYQSRPSYLARQNTVESLDERGLLSGLHTGGTDTFP